MAGRQDPVLIASTTAVGVAAGVSCVDYARWLQEQRLHLWVRGWAVLDPARHHELDTVWGLYLGDPSPRT